MQQQNRIMPRKRDWARSAGTPAAAFRQWRVCSYTSVLQRLITTECHKTHEKWAMHPTRPDMCCVVSTVTYRCWTSSQRPATKYCRTAGATGHLSDASPNHQYAPATDESLVVHRLPPLIWLTHNVYERSAQNPTVNFPVWTAKQHSGELEMIVRGLISSKYVR